MVDVTVTDSGDIGRELRRRLSGVTDVDPASALQLLCTDCTSLLAVDGAAVSVLEGDSGRGGYGASDEPSARLDEMQFTLGEGPCQEVLETRKPVLVPDLDLMSGLWPAFADAASSTGFSAVFAFPVQIGAVLLGVLDLFRGAPGPLAPDELAGALTVADLAAVALVPLPDADPTRPGEPPAWVDLSWVDTSWLGHAEVHQATGMLVAQLGVGPREALARLRARAYARGETAAHLAGLIVRGEVRLDLDDP